MWYLIIPKKYLDRMNFLRLSYEIIVSTITIYDKICTCNHSNTKRFTSPRVDEYKYDMLDPSRRLFRIVEH